MKSDQDFEAIKPFIYQNYQQYRILQPNVIFIHGLPQKYTNLKELQFHLSNYGKVIKISIQFISNNFYSSFVQYQSEISACLAITALDNYYIERRTLKVSFASTKFCPNFLRGMRCYLQNCNYAHYYIAELAHLKDFAKQINHRALALNKVFQNYQEALIQLFRNQQRSLIFPSGTIKLNEILFMKSEQFYQWEKRIQDSIQVLQNQLKKLRQHRSKKSIKIKQKQNENLFEDDWINLDDSISQFLQQETQQNIKSLKRSKTNIQKFLDQSQQKLMELIFKSRMEQFAY